MTQTLQPRSGVTLNEVEDNKKILLSVFDSMNKLNETVNRLNYVLQRKKLEQILYQEKKGGEDGSALRNRLIDDAASLQNSAAANKGGEKK